MNLYKKGFFSLLSIYLKFSNHPHYAAGMYAMAISYNCISIYFLIVGVILGNYEFISKYNFMIYIIGLVAFISNAWYLGFSGNYYKKGFDRYAHRINWINWVGVIFYIVASTVILFWVITLARNGNMAYKQHLL